MYNNKNVKIMKKNLFLAALALVALASCTSDEFVGDTSPNPKPSSEKAIVFSSATGAITRANLTGAEAAAKLNNAFVVEGTKGSTSVAQTVVFDNYNVNYTANTANTTESNTNNWEYVGLDVNSLATIPHNTGDKQTIKYWDYMQPQYDFIAYSLGSGGATATAITPETATTLTIPQGKTVAGAYTISGTTAQLKTAHIADLVTVKDADYGKPVTITFRSLSSKVRMGIYETIPGYSVRDVKFYASATATSSSADNAILYSSGSTLPIKGTYTVYFPHVNITSSSDANYNDNNKAHVSFAAATSGTQANQTFGALSKYVVKEKYEDESTGDNASKIYLGRSSNACTYAGTDPYYQDVLPNENNPAALTLKVDYTLVSIDGTKENISVTGATAVVPAIYTKWLPNYAYTYIFKISDNTNGKTNPSKDAVGLHPITFDAVVVQATDNVQETVTTVATPSITTYQHVPAVNASANNEYKAGDIYVMVMDGGTLKGDLNGVTTTPTKDAAKLYTLSKSATEAEVMDALTMQASVSGNNITGRNGLVLTNVSSLDNTITAIPGPDGNNITVTAGQASKFTASANTYAYVYTVTQSTTNTAKYEAVKPGNGDSVSGYYTDNTGTTQASGIADGNTTYYAKYTVNNGVYAVKVIKVASN